jgi:hypothetical protein
MSKFKAEIQPAQLNPQQSVNARNIDGDSDDDSDDDSEGEDIVLKVNPLNHLKNSTQNVYNPITQQYEKNPSSNQLLLDQNSKEWFDYDLDDLLNQNQQYELPNGHNIPQEQVHTDSSRQNTGNLSQQFENPSQKNQHSQNVKIPWNNLPQSMSQSVHFSQQLPPQPKNMLALSQFTGASQFDKFSTPTRAKLIQQYQQEFVQSGGHASYQNGFKNDHFDQNNPHNGVSLDQNYNPNFANFQPPPNNRTDNTTISGRQNDPNTFEHVGNLGRQNHIRNSNHTKPIPFEGLISPDKSSSDSSNLYYHNNQPFLSQFYHGGMGE